MRTKQFEVPVEMITEFSEALGDSGLNNSVNGVNEEGEILITVGYEKNERATVFELSELIDEFHDENSEEEKD